MVTAFTGLAMVFKDAGLSMATVQRDYITHEQVSNLFWINVTLGVLLTITVAGVSPLLVRYYGEPQLAKVAVAIASIYTISGLGVQHMALLKRQMRFGTLAIIDTASTIVAVTGGVILASNGAGYWALVGVLILQPLVSTVATWCSLPWRPGPPIRGAGVRSLLAFGGHLTGFDFVNYFSRNADKMLLGRLSGSGALGLYSRAYDLMMLPVVTIRAPLISVALPAMSRLQGESSKYRSYYRQMTEALALLTMPIASILFVTADQLIEFALGPEWIGASPIFRALAFVAFLQPSAGLRGLVLLTSGQGKRYFRLGVGIAIVTVLAFVVGASWGPIGVAVAFTIANYLMLGPTLWYAFYGSPVKIGDYFGAVQVPAVCSLLATIITTGTAKQHYFPDGVRGLLASTAVFVLSFILLMVATPQGRAFVIRQLTHIRSIGR